MRRPSRTDVYGAAPTRLVANSTMWLDSAAASHADDGTRPLATRVRARLRDLATRAVDEAAAPVAVAIAYYVSCLVGFALRYPSSGISFFWPPNAVLLTALLIVAPRRWPALIGAAFVAHGLAHNEDGIGALAWSVQYLGNVSQALLGAVVMRRYGALAIHEDSRRSLIFIIGACIAAPAIASLTVVYIYVSLGWANDFFAAWRARSVSNAMATLCLVPSLLALWRYRVRRPALHAWSVVEFVGLLVGLAAPHAIASAVSRSGLLGLSVTLAATTPFLIWAAARFGGVGLSFALTAALLMMSQTATQMGGVGGGLPADTIVGVQLLFTGIAVPLSLLAGLLQQQRTEHRALVDVEHQNRAILRALPDTTLLHTKDGAIVQSYPPRVDDAPASRADAEEPHVREYSEGAGEAARRYEARSVAVDGERTLTIIRDITERWRAQQALIEAQRRYTLALSAGGIGVWHYDVAVPLNLNAVVREVVRIATPRLRALHVRVQEALDPAIPNVYADDVQMQQVLFNLVLNARDALRGVDTNRRVVRVSTRHTRRHVIVSVRDTGIGLDRADTSRIFEPFYTTKETGTGVGLAISRSIVQSHGGTLWGVSNSDFGSTFRFKIPLPTSDATPAPHHTTRVLVVDDDRGMRTALKRLLSGSGYDVAVASNGARAVALTETFRPDAAVIDMSLGEMSGLHLVKRLRALYADRSLFLIALTAYEDEHLRHACLAAGFNAYLVKQTQISELPVLLEQRSG